MSHYFASDPAVPSRRRQIALEAAGRSVLLDTDAGVFSGERIDPGTQVLLSHAPPPPLSGTLVDLGCGYGPIAVWLALHSPRASVLAVDVNARARSLTADNAARLGLVNVLVRDADDPDQASTVTALYSNPPIRIGKSSLHSLLERWLARLAPGGAAHLVVHRNLGSDSLQRWLSEQGWPTERLLSVQGYRLLRATSPS